MHFIIRTSDGGFQVDGAYLPYGTMQGEITNIVITAQILNDGTVDYTYTVNGPLYGGERTGARLNDGTVVSLEEAGVEEVEEPVVLEPTPVEPEPEPEPETPEEPENPVEPEPQEPEEPVTPQPPVEPSDPEPNEPSEPVQPEPEPQPEPSNPQPDPQPEPQQPEPPQPQPEPPVQPEPPQPEPEEPEPEPELEEPEPPIEEEEDSEPEIPQDPEPPLEEEDLEEESENTPEPEDPDTNDIDQESLEEEEPQTPVEPVTPQNPPLDPPSENTIVLQNGVVLPVEIAQALELLSDNPLELLENILSNPAEAFKALANVGADMSPEKREEAQIVVIAAIIIGQIMSTVAAAQMSQARRV